MGCKKPKDDTTKLTNIRPWYVSLVDFGANHGGRDHHFALKMDTIAKRVPSADATDEDKQKALAERAASYGIEARDDAHLSYPAGDPTTESMYGDPSNLKYPLGTDSNEVDLGRVRNALARFKQNAAEYKEEKSRGRVYERIVRAALDNGVEVSFDESDPIDALLPADLKAELQKSSAEETKKALAAIALRAELATISASIVEKSETPKPVVSSPTLDELNALHATVKSATESAEALKKENAALAKTVKGLETKLTTALAKTNRTQHPATSLAGMHPTGDEPTQKRTAGPTIPARFTGGTK